MFTKFTKKFGYALGCFFAVLLVALLLGISWIITCGFIYLITLCFEWTFSWGIATGIWLVMWLLNSIFKRGSDK